MCESVSVLFWIRVFCILFFFPFWFYRNLLIYAWTIHFRNLLKRRLDTEIDNFKFTKRLKTQTKSDGQKIAKLKEKLLNIQKENDTLKAQLESALSGEENLNVNDAKQCFRIFCINIELLSNPFSSLVYRKMLSKLCIVFVDGGIKLTITDNTLLLYANLL